jgi:hypothetical protein
MLKLKFLDGPKGRDAEVVGLVSGRARSAVSDLRVRVFVEKLLEEEYLRIADAE